MCSMQCHALRADCRACALHSRSGLRCVVKAPLSQKWSKVNGDICSLSGPCSILLARPKCCHCEVNRKTAKTACLIKYSVVSTASRLDFKHLNLWNHTEPSINSVSQFRCNSKVDKVSLLVYFTSRARSLSSSELLSLEPSSEASPPSVTSPGVSAAAAMAVGASRLSCCFHISSSSLSCHHDTPESFWVTQGY